MLHPLAPPADHGELLQRFLQANGIDPRQEPIHLLVQVGQAFARLPYENLSKIIKHAETGSSTEAREEPKIVLANHWALGTGGTCFSLTATLLYLVRSLGFEAEPILADRSYGSDTHCALLVWIGGQPHLLDPGYLITTPLPLPTTEAARIPTPFNQVILTPQNEGNKIELATVQQGHRAARLTFKTQPVDAGQFLKAWDASFDWDMMHYPVVTRIMDGRQVYLRKHHFLIRDAEKTRQQDLALNTLAENIARQFGIHSDVVVRALKILERNKK